MFPGEILMNKHAQITFPFQGRVRVSVMFEQFKLNFVFYFFFCRG